MVADFCEGQAWKRPATWTTAERNRFLEDLDRGVFPGLYTPAPTEQGGGHSEEEAPGEEGPGPDGSRAAWSRTKPAYFAALKVFGVDPVGLDTFYEAHGLPLLDEQTAEQRSRFLEKLGRGRMSERVNEWLANSAAFGGEA